MKYIVLDFETDDPWIDLKRGSGWPEKQATFLCAGTYDEQEGYKYWDKESELGTYLCGFSHIIAHNASYDMGILLSLGVDITKFTWICTRIMAILMNNNLMSFSLDNLSKTYLGLSKNSDDTIGQVAIDLGLVKPSCKQPGKAATAKFMKDIFLAHPEKMSEYVLHDVECTIKLWRYIQENLEPAQETIEFYSDLQKALTLSRSNGINIHLPTLETLYQEINAEIRPLKAALDKYDLNPASPKQLAAYFLSEGYDLPLTEKGQASTGIEALETIDHPLAHLILEYRGAIKIRDTYLEPIRELVQSTGNTGEYFKVYPEIMIFGAHRTGRCSARDPNIQNIPTRKKMGNKVRGIFHPHHGCKFASFDYNGQELRLIVHVAATYNLEGAKHIVTEYQTNPLFDMHQVGADILGIPRKKAKEIVLGIPYGLWHKTMAKKLDIGELEAEQYMDRITNTFPFLQRIASKATKLMKERGYIKDISGRKIYMDKDWAKKALNGAIQGSAAYQTNKAIVDCYREGIIIDFPIHDELVVSYKTEEELKKITRIMENAVKLAVPSVVNMKTGLNWGELK